MQCWMHLDEDVHWQIYMVLVALTVLVIPTIIIALCYAIIVYTIWSKSKIMTPTHLKSSCQSKYQLYFSLFKKINKKRHYKNIIY